MKSSKWINIYRYPAASYRGGYLRFYTQYLVDLPISTIDFFSPADVVRHDQLLQLRKDLVTAATPHDRELLTRQITATDAEIDRLVY